MIKDYKKEEVIQKLSDNCVIYKALKMGKAYFMYEYNVMNQCDEYNFKVIKKLLTCTHVLGVLQKFQYNQNTYFITQFVGTNLLKQQYNQSNHIFQLAKALQYFAKLVQIIEELHQNNVIYRNFRNQVIKFQKNQLFLSDFSFSQIIRRKERYFEPVGVVYYMAPEFFSEDGYGYEADIWSAGVCLYFMLTGQFPFNLKDKSEQQIVSEFQKKCKKGFDFLAIASETKKAKSIKSSKALQDLFRKIFELDYLQRITVNQLKAHPSLQQFFNSNQTKKIFEQDLMSQILQQSTQIHASIFASMLQQYPCHYEFHKQEVVLDFLQHSSEILMLNSPVQVNQKMKTILNFSILKVGVMKAKHMIDILYGRRNPQFKIDIKQWQQIRKTSAFSKVKQKIERKKKILDMLFRAAFLNVQNYVQKSKYYSQQIPQDFSEMKHQYRKILSQMFEIQKQIMKKKQSKMVVRKVCQNLARLTILCMINRIFQEGKTSENFELYYKWSRKESLQDLQQWIENEKISNLKQFIKTITTKYME